MLLYFYKVSLFRPYIVSFFSDMKQAQGFIKCFFSDKPLYSFHRARRHP
jgi:hypothetical protein